MIYMTRIEFYLVLIAILVWVTIAGGILAALLSDIRQGWTGGAWVLSGVLLVWILLGLIGIELGAYVV